MSKVIPPVSKFMTPTPITVERTTTLAEASRLMKEHDIRHLPVVAGDRLVGIITERDISFVRSFELVDPTKVSVYGAMAEELYTVSPDAPVSEVVSLMAQKKLGSILVVQGKQIIGLLTTVDVCRAFSELIAAGA